MNASELARLERLEQAVFAEIEAKAEKIRKAAEKEAGSLMDSAESETQQQSEERMQELLKASEAKYKRLLSGGRLEYRRQLLKRRCELTDDIFAAVRKRITDFTASPDYTDYLSRSLNKITLVEGDILAVRPSDAQMHVFLDKKVAVKPDARILLGGFMVIRGSIISDYTLDAALRRRCDSFGADYGDIFRRCDE